MEIQRPTLVVDYDRLERNLQKMLHKANKSDVIFRPHFKTHQSAEIAKCFRKHGVKSITVSSVSMARYFADHGWDDICIAFPLNILEIDEIVNLSRSITLSVLVESSVHIETLMNNIATAVGVWIKIDTGYHRTGLSSDDKQIEALIQQIRSSNHLIFKGFLTHAGHTYYAKGQSEILNIMVSARKQMTALKDQYQDSGSPVLLSYGDTPSCSLATDFSGFDEIRPGNFVYYDVMQYHLGSCALDDIAVAIACPVVAKHKQRNEIVIYGGGVHLSKEFIAGDNGFKLYGYVVEIKDKSWGEPIAGAYVSSLSQEHGIVYLPASDFHRFKEGDLLGVLPIHSCMPANLLPKP